MLLNAVIRAVPTTVERVKNSWVWRRRGWGNPYIHTGKSVSLSPLDKSPLDKCGQAGQEPSFSNDGVQDSDKVESPLGEMCEQGKRPPAEKLSQQQCSFQLWLPKPLKKFTHRHSTHSANIGYCMRPCVFNVTACAHVWLHILLKNPPKVYCVRVEQKMLEFWQKTREVESQT